MPKIAIPSPFHRGSLLGSASMALRRPRSTGETEALAKRPRGRPYKCLGKNGRMPVSILCKVGWMPVKPTAWWFGRYLDYFPFHIWDVILPIDELILRLGFHLWICQRSQHSEWEYHAKCHGSFRNHGINYGNFVDLLHSS